MLEYDWGLLSNGHGCGKLGEKRISDFCCLFIPLEQQLKKKKKPYLVRGRRDCLRFLLLDLDSRHWSRIERIQKAQALHS